MRLPRTLAVAAVMAAMSAACSGGSTTVGSDNTTSSTSPPPATTTVSASLPPATVPVVIITTTVQPSEGGPETASSDPSATTATTTTTASGACATVPTGLVNTSIDAGGSVHDLRIFVPSSASGVDALPTVLDWHGYDQSGPAQAELSGFEALAEAEGFMVVHPTGVPNPGRSANGWELSPGRDPGRDDLAFVAALIDELESTWCADPSRVYSTGMSDGGFFTSILVCEMADRIAAASSVAGVMRTPGCSPSRVVPYYAFHGTADPVEPFDPDFAAFGQFATDAGCGPAVESRQSDEVVRVDYEGCSLKFFRIEGGGHAWPGSPVADAQPGWLGHTTSDIDATRVSWELFTTVALAG